MNLQAYAHKLYITLIKEANVKFNTTFEQLPLKFSNRMKSTGGYFRYDYAGGVNITLNNRMMEQNGEAFVKEVLTHEFAHQVTLKVYGRNVQAHGREWKSVMRKLGAKPSRTHSYKRVGTKNTFTYEVAPGVSVDVGKIRHNKLQRGSTYTLRTATGERYTIAGKHYVGTPEAIAPKKPTKKVTNGKPGSKSSMARMTIRGWIRMGYCLEGALQSNACIQEMIMTAGLSGVAQSKSYIKTQWHKA